MKTIPFDRKHSPKPISRGRPFDHCVLWVGILSLMCWLWQASTAHAAYPASWPSSWAAYTVLGSALGDPTSSSDGTYGVSATPATVDYFQGTSGTLTTVYYAYDATNQVFFVRMRMRGDPRISNPGNNAGPFDAYAWHIVFDLSGDGFKDFVIVLDGMSGKQSDPYDDIETYYSALARRQDFNSDPCASGGDQVWKQNATNGSSGPDFAYTRVVDETGTGGGYLLDVQVPLTSFVDCSGRQILTETTPFMLVFTTSTQNNNPTQKDLVAPGTYSMSATGFLPAGDPMTLRDGITQSPLLTDLRSSCAGSTTTLTTYTIDTLQISGGNIVDTIDNVTYYYKNGATWTQIGSPVTTPNTTTVNEWAINWNTTGLSGTYPLRIVITDDQSHVTTDEHWSIDLGTGTCDLKPLLATVSSFNASRRAGSVLVEWETSSEVGTVGFHLFRQDPVTGEFLKVNDHLLPGLLHTPQGGLYQIIDPRGSTGAITYTLVEVMANGREQSHGPMTVHIGEEGISEPKKLRSDAPENPNPGFARVAHETTGTVGSRAEKDSPGSVRIGSPSGSHLRIGIAETGMYFISDDDIASYLGLPSAQVQSYIGQGSLGLTHRGQFVPYLPSQGNGGITFFGQKPDSIYTRENIYWLRVGKGKRMEEVPGSAPTPSGSEGIFTETLHFEQDVYPVTALPVAPNSDYWFWDYVVAGVSGFDQKMFHLDLPGAVNMPTGATLIVNLQGLTKADAGVPDHHAVVTLNGTQVGEIQWVGQASCQLVSNVDQSLLIDGQNTVEVHGILDAGVPQSLFYVDSFDITYQRYYRAVDDALSLRGDQNLVVTVRGFVDPQPFVYDVTDGMNPKRLSGTTIDTAEDRYRVSFCPASPAARYTVLSQQGFSRPYSMAASTPRSLKGKNKGASYLMIVPDVLYDTARRLATYRQGKGLSTEVVSLEDITMEYNHGIPSPEAVKSFLSSAYRTWTPRPKHVVLVGNGTFDYRDIQGKGDNLLPPLMVSTPDGLFGSDVTLADVEGDDGVPEMAIGRLPVRTAAELEQVIDKIIGYEGAPAGEWNKRILLVADDPDEAGDFPAASEDVAVILPLEYLLTRIYLSDKPIDLARQLLLSGVNRGAAFLNYVGHGNLDRFAHEGILLRSDVATFTNGQQLPVVTAMTCLVSRFEIPGLTGLGGEMLLSGGGAVAVWGPTGLALYEELRTLEIGFYESIFGHENGANTVGDAVLYSLSAHKASGGDRSARFIYNLLGDPALSLRK